MSRQRNDICRAVRRCLRAIKSHDAIDGYAKLHGYVAILPAATPIVLARFTVYYAGFCARAMPAIIDITAYARRHICHPRRFDYHLMVL